MPDITMYLADLDVSCLREWLCRDEEIAFIARAEDGQWRAESAVDELPDGKHALWHIPGGRLPLPGAWPPVVEDPWKGWLEVEPKNPSFGPWFGVGPLSVIRLKICRIDGTADPRLSSISWTGKRYSRLGSTPSATTERWWRRCRKWMAVNAQEVRRLDRLKPNAFAFEEAQRQLALGESKWVLNVSGR